MAPEASQGYQADAVENAILAQWRTQGTFQASIESRRGSPPFIFLEGPPTANGMPHAGHVLTRTLKDAVCRYQTMRGRLVERKAGWDCHGLPVEIEVEKELGLKDKKDIEAYGVGKFNAKCRESVFRYLDEWVAMSERVGYWLDFDNAYVTLTNEYIESVWWSLKQAWDKGLLYKGYRVSPSCPRCGTALSSHEVAQGYKDVEEPSVFVKFRRQGTTNEYFLAWTTTPWTLPGNVGLAVGPDIEYVTVEQQTPTGSERYTLARSCLGVLRGEFTEVSSQKGSQLEGARYEPLFADLRNHLDKADAARAWIVAPADFVTTEDGTGIVHTAVMYGEDDYVFGERLGFPKVHTVAMDGTFHDFVKPYAGVFVKDADPKIIEDLREAGLLYRVKNNTHSYPFCWRCSTPLLYYARDSWFLSMTKLRDRLVAHNSTVNWLPEHTREGRFGEFIANVRDWALSRDRYWGTPLPVWACTNPDCGHRTCIGSIEELYQRMEATSKAKTPRDKLDLHKPFVDEIKLTCEQCDGVMERDPSVIDTWYDSGAAHFAQWHHPFDTKDAKASFTPVDFVSEGIDQTRGWFYSLLATATMVFDRPAYRNVVVGGLVLDGNGQKMSKSKRNYTDPNEIFKTYGADAMRWSLLSASAPWADKRFTEASVREAYTRMVLTLWNTFSFFRTYRDLDAWTGGTPPKALGPLDRWLASRRQSVARAATKEADAYQYHKAIRLIEEFLINDVSNWWLRRSRRRFWSDAQSADKEAAYWSLDATLRLVCQLAAPFAPFVTEHIWGRLRRPEDAESVHMTDYPDGRQGNDDSELEEAMQRVRELAEGARAMRAKAGIKNRIPLASATIVRRGQVPAAFKELLPTLQAELNVKQIEFAESSSAFEATEAKINQQSLGRALKGEAKPILAALRDADARALAKQLDDHGRVSVVTPQGEVEVAAEHFTLTTVEKEGTAKAESAGYVLFLDTTLTPELEAEGWAREVVRRIQEMRKDHGCAVDEEIATVIEAPPAITGHLKGWAKYVGQETRSGRLAFEAAGPKATDWDIEGETVRIRIQRS
jgi:isoleucyl-tRNA synthetase